MVINGKAELSKLENLGFFGNGGEKSPEENVSPHPVGKTQRKEATLQLFCILEIETVTAANLLIGCLETRKQEVFSHCCQD